MIGQIYYDPKSNEFFIIKTLLGYLFLCHDFHPKSVVALHPEDLFNMAYIGNLND